MKNIKVEEASGRKSLDKNRKSNADFIKANFNFNDPSNMSNKIKQVKNLYINQIRKAGKDIEDIENKSLAELKDFIDVNQIEFKQERKTDWKKHEADVVDGINVLFENGVFFKNKADNKEETFRDINGFKAELVGGAIQSDVKVSSPNGNFFFVECKLNFDAAEYFKYKLKIVNKSIWYDHSKYINGLVDQEQVAKINQLFEKDVNINAFLNSLVNQPKIKASWNQFLQNAIGVEKFIQNSQEFQNFAKNVKFNQVWPDDFANFVKVFDVYSEYYIRKYDQLIKNLFEYFNSESLDINDFQILYHNNSKSKHVFNKLNVLLDVIEQNQLEVFNKKAFESTIQQIRIIESKFNTLLTVLGHQNDISYIKNLKDKEKTKYFFKMFLSSVKRKTKDTEYNDLSTEDELGNMQICSAIPVKTNDLAKLITNFYVKKDNCAYIQIEDTIYLLDKNFNPFNLENLPLFIDCMNKFNVTFIVSDDLKSISLHIKAIKPEISNSQKLSFKQSDRNYIKNIYKNGIEI